MLGFAIFLAPRHHLLEQERPAVGCCWDAARLGAYEVVEHEGLEPGGLEEAGERLLPPWQSPSLQSPWQGMSRIDD